MRRGAPSFAARFIGNQYVIDNAGHGGSGWTLGPGSAFHSVQKMEGQFGCVDKYRAITVLGGGAVGLFTAYELVKRGYTNVTIVARDFEDLTSHRAGGLLAPVSMDNAGGFADLITQMGIDAYNFYAEVASGKLPEFARGARFMPTYSPRGKIPAWNLT